jgi:GNAT superfamily N-acetyltransferase
MPPVYRTVTDTASLLPLLPSICELADTEKEALSFLPEVAYREGVMRQRIVAMVAQGGGKSSLAGYVFFSGVFPHAGIQQVAVDPKCRRSGVASALLNGLAAQLESQGYLTIKAAIASDLPEAQSFYAKNGFVHRHSRQGGVARGRTILLYVRDLDTRSFFSLLEPRAAATPAADLGLRQRSAGAAPIYAIDLNVLFDLVKNRPRAPLANRLFGAALGHQLRLVTAPEFLHELRRSSTDLTNDSLLNLALQLPRLPIVDEIEVARLAALVHQIVFETPGRSAAGSPQALSDARHVAQAALARASGYVTSDGVLLSARDSLNLQIGIDVASLDELAALLPADGSVSANLLKGANFETKILSLKEVRSYLQSQRVSPLLRSTFAPEAPPADHWRAVGISEEGEIVAIGVYLVPNNVDAPACILIHARADHLLCETLGCEPNKSVVG